MHQAHGLHHIIKKKKKNTYDKFMYGFAMLTPLSVLPQIQQIFIHHSVGGVSLATWTVFEGSSLLWLVYGLKHKAHAIVVNNVVSFLLQGVVLAGIFLYR
ncbi:hypothetical protein C5B42_04490 [Candidatus Cerribacteria bacterium 'Amazon FNV 2010 28 9']|uniref:MtN3 and saliva related transmembrane protein n=1 Tax=Candidatus Cerribacteria bacterium 'Amazon FNV 2010 28 9' TaxID=2081795 RepID=A0A317JS23_9BACT|nr:MAG: hypothetical protein C5B42_04490 [Candidatus Cerribacteria bacterium 'Amazon FNV 2010 28 9']